MSMTFFNRMRREQADREREEALSSPVFTPLDETRDPEFEAELETQPDPEEQSNQQEEASDPHDT